MWYRIAGCEEAIAAITRLTHFVQTLSSRVDTSFERLTGQLNLALYAIISHRSQVLIFIIVKIIHVNVHTKIGTYTCKTDKCKYTFITPRACARGKVIGRVVVVVVSTKIAISRDTGV